jgi:hypothetical protein
MVIMYSLSGAALYGAMKHRKILLSDVNSYVAVVSNSR